MVPTLSFAGRIIKVAKDQDGSRFIQQRLTLVDNSEVQLVYDETMPAIEGDILNIILLPFYLSFNSNNSLRLPNPHTELWNDVYGNFIIQKLLEFGTAAMNQF